MLGYDAAGLVRATGPEATLFKPGDAVFYAGAIGRQGTNSEFHLVDERIVGRKPNSLDWAEAAAIPLTAITAWEMLFDRLNVRRAVPGSALAVLIVGGAGGIGSIAIQLAKKVTATDGDHDGVPFRDESLGTAAWRTSHHRSQQAARRASESTRDRRAWPGVFDNEHRPSFRGGCRTDRSAGTVWSHRRSAEVRYCAVQTQKRFDIHSGSMFTRSVFETPDMTEQGALLNEVSKLVDEEDVANNTR